MLHKRAPLLLALCTVLATLLTACGSAGEDAGGDMSSIASAYPGNGLVAESPLQASTASTISPKFLADAGLTGGIVRPWLGDLATRFRDRTFLRVNRGQPVEGIEANKPTIVLTHGWQPFPESSFGDTPSLFDELAAGWRARLGDAVNIVEFHWEGAYTPLVFIAGVMAEVAGSRLAEEVAAVLPLAYAQHIHLMGHSHGTVVNATALDSLAASGIRVTQVTMLEAPSRFGNEESDQAGGYGANFFSPIYDRSNVLYVDNHFGTGVLAFGAPIPGAHNLPYPDANHLNIARRYVDQLSNGSVTSVTQFPAGQPPIPLYMPQNTAALQARHAVSNSLVSIPAGAQ